jgi:alpha-beta hydrolase superfamily lysophospholipase
MTHPTLLPATTAWNEPDGTDPRGTVVVLIGRGEHPGAYERFGRRIASDAYRVRIASGPAHAARLLRDAADPAPRVLLGADVGALRAVALALPGASEPDALILAGLPSAASAPAPTSVTPGAAAAAGIAAKADDLALRSACTTYAGLLDRAGYRPGALTAPLPPELLAEADLGAVTVPVLALHGADDQVSPLKEVRRLYAGLPGVHLVSIAGTRHDVLNDTSHRTVAATVILFLEQLRLSPDLPEIVRPEPHRSAT